MENLTTWKTLPCILKRELKPRHQCWDFFWPSWSFVFLFLITTEAWGGPVMHQAVNSITSNGAVVDLQRFSRSHFVFSLDLYSALAEQNPSNSEGEAGNLLFSPYSVSTALSMIFLGAGAGSSTSLQLRSALHLNNFSFSDVHDSYKTVLSKLADPYYGEILVAMNGIFQQEGVYISEKYKRALEEFYHVRIQPIDLVRHPQLALDDSWARNFTRQKTAHLLRKPNTPTPSNPKGISRIYSIVMKNCSWYSSTVLYTYKREII